MMNVMEMGPIAYMVAGDEVAGCAREEVGSSMAAKSYLILSVVRELAPEHAVPWRTVIALGHVQTRGFLTSEGLCWRVSD